MRRQWLRAPIRMLVAESLGVPHFVAFRKGVRACSRQIYFARFASAFATAGKSGGEVPGVAAEIVYTGGDAMKRGATVPTESHHDAGEPLQRGVVAGVVVARSALLAAVRRKLDPNCSRVACPQ